jgi:hypothetical protein
MRRPLALLVAVPRVLASLIAPATTAAAGLTVKLVATDDSYVVSNASTGNYGSSQKLLVDHSPLTRFYLKFNVTSIKGTITAANSTPGFDLRAVGTKTSRAFSHYSLLRTTEELLGIGTFLGHAADAATLSMRSEFNI